MFSIEGDKQDSGLPGIVLIGRDLLWGSDIWGLVFGSLMVSLMCQLGWAGTQSYLFQPQPRCFCGGILQLWLRCTVTLYNLQAIDGLLFLGVRLWFQVLRLEMGLESGSGRLAKGEHSRRDLAGSLIWSLTMCPTGKACLHSSKGRCHSNSSRWPGVQLSQTS